MKKAPFGNTGFQVTPLGFGGAPIGYLKAEREHAARILNQLLDAGVNLIDTAANYAGSEEMIAEAVGHRRDQFILVSKCGQKFPDLQGEAWTAAMIAQTIDRSLKRLRTDRLDVLLLHTCDLATLQKGEGLAALVAARQAGKVRFVGYSGDNEAAAYAATLPDVAVIETSVNIADQANIDTLLPLTRQKNIGVIAKRPIANAAWKAEPDQHAGYREYARPYAQRLQGMRLSPADLGFPGDPARAWPEIALRFTLAQPGVHTAIVGTINPDRVRDNLRFAERGPLPAELVQIIRESFRRAEGGSGEKWAGLG